MLNRKFVIIKNTCPVAVVDEGKDECFVQALVEQLNTRESQRGHNKDLNKIMPYSRAYYQYLRVDEVSSIEDMRY